MLKFKVYNGETLLFETGAIDVDRNIFDGSINGKSGYTNSNDGWLGTNIIDGQTTVDNLPSNKHCGWLGNGAPQRSAICVSDGTHWQALVGGLNGDIYVPGNGPYMCQLDNMCGTPSANTIEIYYKGSG